MTDLTPVPPPRRLLLACPWCKETEDVYFRAEPTLTVTVGVASLSATVSIGSVTHRCAPLRQPATPPSPAPRPEATT